MKKSIRNLLIMAAVIIVGTVILLVVSKLGKQNVAKEEKLETFKINVSDKTFVNGVVESVDSKTIYIDATKGKVASVEVTDGQQVNTGDVLFVYENNSVSEQISDYESQINTAQKQKTRLQEKKSDAEGKLSDIKNKIEELKGKVGQDLDGSITQELSEAKAQESALNTEIETCKEQVETSEDSISQLTDKKNRLNEHEKEEVTADVNGVVSIVGDKNDSTVPFMKINSSDLCVKGTVSEKIIHKLSDGMEAELLIIADNSKKTGKIIELGKEPSTTTSSALKTQSMSSDSSSLSQYKVVLSLSDAEGILPGYHVQAMIKKQDENIKVPDTAVNAEENSLYVIKVEDGKYIKKAVNAEKKDNEYIIKSGLADQDEILKQYTENVKEGVIIE